MRRVRNDRRRRRGVEVLELLMVAPIFVLALVASVEYVPLLIAQACITHAATVGAREAAKGANAQAVAAAVNVVLATNSIVITNTPSSGMRVVVENGATVTSWGDPTLTVTTPPPAVNAGNVRVTVCVLFSALKADGSQILGPYNAFGYILHGNRFQIRALVNNEI
jgi:Flp pilus assembly protein TadG